VEPVAYYSQSIPRSLLVTAGRVPPAEQPAGGGEAGNFSSAGASLTVDAGTPGSYSPAVKASERPRNVTELVQRAVPNGRAPWDAGQYVPVGTSGKRAHWTGAEWRGGESPGYAPADVQFPGVDDGSEDLHR
jgi:hypothetical protein